MKPTKWTKRRPRKAGYYWMRHIPTKRLMGLSWFNPKAKRCLYSMGLDVFGEDEIEWSGPIEPPK